MNTEETIITPIEEVTTPSVEPETAPETTPTEIVEEVSTPVEEITNAGEETPLEVTAEEAEAIAKEFVATCYNQQGEFVQGFQNLDEAYAFAGENGYQVSVK